MTMGLCLQMRVIIHDAKPLTYQSALEHSLCNTMATLYTTVLKKSSKRFKVRATQVSESYRRQRSYMALDHDHLPVRPTKIASNTKHHTVCLVQPFKAQFKMQVPSAVKISNCALCIFWSCKIFSANRKHFLSRH